MKKVVCHCQKKKNAFEWPMALITVTVTGSSLSPSPSPSLSTPREPKDTATLHAEFLISAHAHFVNGFLLLVKPSELHGS